jgi:hypothetical protein
MKKTTKTIVLIATFKQLTFSFQEARMADDMSAKGKQWADGRILWNRVDVEGMVHKSGIILVCLGYTNLETNAIIPHFSQLYVGIDCNVCPGDKIPIHQQKEMCNDNLLIIAHHHCSSSKF